MRWSIQELIEALRLHKDFPLRYRIFNCFSILKYNFRTFFTWLFKGYTPANLWNLNTYLLEVLIDRITLFKKINIHSHPFDFKSIEEWHDTLDKLVDLLTKTKDEYYFDLIDSDEIREEYIDKQVANDKEALELLSKYLLTLWD